MAGEAQRIIDVINQKVSDNIASGALERRTPGVVYQSFGSGYEASAYVRVTDFVSDVIVPNGMVVAAGDYVSIAEDGEGKAWIDRLIPASLYSKMAVDYERREIHVGSGDVEAEVAIRLPADTAAGDTLAAGADTIITVRKNNISATAPPNEFEDNTHGYTVGSQWLDVFNNIVYTCTDATTNAAVWSAGGGGVGEHAIEDHTNVGGTPQEGEALTWDSNTSTWIPQSNRDITPPEVPNGVNLSSTMENLADGTLAISVEVTWVDVPDADLDAYDVWIEEAIQQQAAFSVSVSGTGGTLPAGTYSVQVTGLGSWDGETASPIDQIEAIAVSSGQRLYVNILPILGCSSYNVYASILTGGQFKPKFSFLTTTTGSNVEITTAGLGGLAPDISDAMGFLNPLGARVVSTNWKTYQISGGSVYGGMVRAVDTSGNASDWSTIAYASTAEDTVAPPTPAGVVVAGGYRLIGASWIPVNAIDLRNYEFRYARHTEAAPYVGFNTNPFVTGGWWRQDDSSTTWENFIDQSSGYAVRTIGDGTGEERMSIGVGTGCAVPITAGTYYKFDLDMKTTSLTLPGYARVLWYDDTPTQIGTNTDCMLEPTLVNTWENLSGIFLAPTGATQARVDLLLGNNSTVTATFDNVTFTPLNWTIIAIDSTIAVVQDLEPDVKYYVQVRSIDTSNNTRTSVSDATAVKAFLNTEAGWSNNGVDEPMIYATPSLVGAADVAFNSVVTRLLDVGTMDADVITSGTLIVGGNALQPTYLVVKDASEIPVELLRIDKYGLVGRDPANPSKAMRWWRGRLEFTNDYDENNPNLSQWTAALSADGLVADVITLGSQPGGHNMVANSGFELAPFSVPNAKVWTSQTGATTGWDTWISGTNINVASVDVSGNGVLQLVSYT